jgi:hypothetical protein
MESRRNLEARGTSDDTHEKSHLHTSPVNARIFMTHMRIPRLSTAQILHPHARLPVSPTVYVLVQLWLRRCNLSPAFSPTDAGARCCCATYSLGHHAVDAYSMA